MLPALGAGDPSSNLGSPILNSKAFYMGKLILGAMENYTDLAFRLLCQKYGANITITEMTSSIAIYRQNKKSLDRIKIPKQEKNGYVQVMGTSHKEFYDGIKTIVKLIDSKENYAKGIDINFGCPSKNIYENKAGSYLLKYPKKIKEIITNTTKICPYPISCKLRLGYSNKNEIFDIIKELNETGLTSAIIHGRTKIQGYSGESDWKILEQVRDKAKFITYGNGDILTLNQAEEKFKEGWKGISIARAAKGNPKLFSGKKSDKGDFLEYIKIAKKIDELDFKKIKLHALCFEKNKYKKIEISKLKNIEELLLIFTN